MFAAHFKPTLALVTVVGFGFLVYDYAAGRIDPTQSLSGTISIQGKPMNKGIVRFISLDPDKPTSYGSFVKNGRYQVPAEYGITPARYQVEFSSIGAEDVQHLLDTGNQEERIEVKEEVPARFNQNSEVQIDLSSGSVLQADFDLK